MHSKTSINKKSHGSKHKSKKPSKSSSSSGTPEESSKEKNYKSYPGFSPKSVRSMWEQHERSNETEVSAEAIQKVAEDLTYKIWEVANSIKTFATKSSGHVTVDLVNEVLKDSNVDPIVGASNSFWDRIELDGTFFFNYDEVVDLQEEYAKDVVVEEPGPLSLKIGWFGEPNRQQELIEFYGNLVDAIYYGDQKILETALDMLAFNPHVALILKLLLGKCIEILCLEYSNDVLQRSLKLLNALTVNPSTQNGTVNEELNYLSQLFEGLLLGSTIEIPQTTDNQILNQAFDIKMDVSQPEQFYNQSGQFQDGIQQQQQPSFGQDDLLLKNFKPPETFKTEEQEINEIKKECEDFLMMMDTNEMVIKKEEQADLVPEAQLLGGIDELPLYSNNDRYNNQDGAADVGDNVSIKISEVSSEPEQRPEVPDKIRLVTVKCDFTMVEELIRTIGLCASHWGYFEQNLTYLLVKRLTNFFDARNSIPLHEFFEAIYRIVSGLWSIGEYAFREFTVHLEKLDPAIMPDYLIPIFSRGAIYLKGRSDIFLYEWLQEMCGNSLQAFVTFYPDYLLRHNKKIFNRIKLMSNHDGIYRIPPKIQLKPIRKIDRMFDLQCCDTIFEDYKLIKKREKKKFNFRFAGCRPISLRARKNKLVQTVVEPIIVQQPLDYFNKRVIIGKRRLLKPVTNIPKMKLHSNFHWMVF